MDHTATYSPDDNKLRLYPASRLDKLLYDRVKAHGFSWAPKQELFVAGMWTPEREDLLIDLCGEIGDEDTSLIDRAEVRAERFEDYSEKRAADAESARKAVSAIADNIPLGQPILIGHHSEKHARRDAAKIENGMRKAVNMWKTSQYWTGRAAGALRHAKYLERADVRARRIKKLEAEQRKQQKIKAEAEQGLKLWNLVDFPEKWKTRADGTRPTRESIANTVSNAASFTVLQQDGHFWSAYNVLRPEDERYKICPRMTIDQVQEAARTAFPARIAHCERWIEHYENRLSYERAMLNEQGGTITQKTGPEVGGGCKCWCSPRGGWSYIKKVNKVSVTVLDNWGNGGANFTRTIPFDKLSHVMTLAQVEAMRQAGKIKDDQDGQGFYLLQSREDFDRDNPPEDETTQDKAEAFKAMETTLSAGIQIVTAPQLFPTPRDIAQQMTDLADIRPGHKVLEPSAGTGNLLEAIQLLGLNGSIRLEACELNIALADTLASKFKGVPVYPGDFLAKTAFELGAPVDRILMNPPFLNGADIKHIKHALTMLKPGGKLVAICANGPRQQATLKPLASEWIDLPQDSFKEQGTGVNTALLVINSLA